jgi:hypothetical protein
MHTKKTLTQGNLAFGEELSGHMSSETGARKAGLDASLDREPQKEDQQAPQIEPWPPPIPTDQAVFTIDRTNLKTVGDFEDALVQRLHDAGIRHLRFWGAPNGVAVVAPFEAIDETARPVRTTAIATGAQTERAGPLSAIFEGFRVLLSEPIRDFRQYR